MSSNKLFEILINIENNIDLGGIQIWNYNKNSQSSIIGIKNLQVFVNGKTVWTGDIKKGTGKELQENASTIIYFSK